MTLQDRRRTARRFDAQAGRQQELPFRVGDQGILNEAAQIQPAGVEAGEITFVVQMAQVIQEGPDLPAVEIGRGAAALVQAKR